MRPTVLVPFFTYFLICTVPLAVGVCLLISPRRAGNFLNDAFIVFPHVETADAAKKWFYRLLGGGSVGVSAVAVHHVYLKILLPLLRTLH